ncbi:MAG: ARMT1-like domain-containing protein [Anaerolineae bacterium]
MPEPLRPPAPIRTDASNAFAQHTMAVRVPAIVRAVATKNPDYPPHVLAALEALAVAMETNQSIPSPAPDWPDYDQWIDQWEAHAGETWGGAEWFFAEIYLYRLVIATVGWFETGRDPFAPDKAVEMANSTLWNGLAAALALVDEDDRTRLDDLITMALWSNRIDLSLASVAAHGTHAHEDDLLADDHHAALSALLGNLPGAVHIVCDNTGTELALDLALADALLDGAAETVTMHLKAHPTFVSDAILPDVEAFLARLADDWYPVNKGLADRLNLARLDGRLIFAPHLVWNSARFLRDFPVEALRWFEGAALVITKGDLNYRRLVGDAMWPGETPFSDVLAWFPAPLLALRTLKSDPVVGLAPGQAERLDAESPGWRTNGRRGVMQYKP